MWGQHHNVPHQPPQLQQQQQQQQPNSTAAPQTPSQTPHNQVAMNKLGNTGTTAGAVGQWAPGAMPNSVKDLPVQQHKSSGWEEPSPPTQRRNMPNFDDGTSLWGQQQPQAISIQQNRGPSHATGTHWKEDIPRNSIRNPPSSTQNANTNIVGSSAPLSQSRSGPNPKSDNLLWSHGGNVNTNRNPSWEENSQNWEEKNIVPPANIANSWGDTHASNVWAQQQKQKHMIGNSLGPNNLGWPEPESNEWGSNAHLPKPQSIKNAVVEKIRSSKQYRVLIEMGFKKEDIELALHATTLNLEEALEILNQSRSNNSVEAWRRHEDPHNFDQNNFSQRFPNPNAQLQSLAFAQVCLHSIKYII